MIYTQDMQYFINCLQFHGISRKGNYTGQYVYDPTFGENENSEQEEYFSEIPFMSYISSTQVSYKITLNLKSL